MGSSDPLHWPVVLDQLARLKVEKIVPGHGPVVGEEGIQPVRDYLAAVVEMAGAAPGASLTRPSGNGRAP